ncbi:MAG: hypothetical protein WCA81_09060 [Rhizomicrobium sp.]
MLSDDTQKRAASAAHDRRKTRPDPVGADYLTMPKFVKRRSGIRRGRPKLIGAMRELCQAQTEANIKVLIAIRDDKKQPGAVRVAAITAMMDRAYGKPAQLIGGDKENPLEMVLRDARTTLATKFDRITHSES